MIMKLLQDVPARRMDTLASFNKPVGGAFQALKPLLKIEATFKE